MPVVNVNIQPEIISWALSQTQEEKLGDKLMNLLNFGRPVIITFQRDFDTLSYFDAYHIRNRRTPMLAIHRIVCYNQK